VQQCKINDSNKFNFKIYPWDEAVFGYKVSEITNLKGSTPKNVLDN